MRTATVWTLLLLLGTWPCALNAQGGNLQQVRQDVRDGPTRNAGEENEDWDSGCSEEDDFLSALCGDCLGQCLAASLEGTCWLIGLGLFKLPAHLVGDDWQTDACFLPHPYAGSQAGFMVLLLPAEFPAAADRDEWRTCDAPPPLPCTGGNDLPGLRTWSGRCALEGSDDCDGLTRINGQLLLATQSRLGLQAGWSYLREHLGNGRHDRMWLGDANVTCRFAQAARVQLRAGVGFRWLADRRDSDFGVNFLYGGDFFPVEPVVISSNVAFGNLGSAFVVHGRATVGLLWSRWELLGGYDWLRIGSVNLQGPLAGLRLWF